MTGVEADFVRQGKKSPETGKVNDTESLIDDGSAAVEKSVAGESSQGSSSTAGDQPLSSQGKNTNTISITIPATPEQLEDWAKGPTESALTWLAFYWIRMIKKAIMHGWRIFVDSQ
jgi:hypothetical protein